MKNHSKVPPNLQSNKKSKTQSKQANTYLGRN